MFNFEIVVFACLFFTVANCKPLRTGDGTNRAKRALLERVFNNENPERSLVEKFLEIKTRPVYVHPHGSYNIFYPAIEDDEDYSDYDSGVDYIEEENINTLPQYPDEPHEAVAVENEEIDHLGPHATEPTTDSSNGDNFEDNYLTGLLLPETLDEVEMKNIFIYPNNYSPSSTESTDDATDKTVTENAENATFVTETKDRDVTQEVDIRLSVSHVTENVSPVAENVASFSPATENIVSAVPMTENIASVTSMTENGDPAVGKLFTSYLNDSQTSTDPSSVPDTSSIPPEATSENVFPLLINQSNLDVFTPEECVSNNTNSDETNGVLAKNCSKSEDTKNGTTLSVSSSLEQRKNNSDTAATNSTKDVIYDKMYIEFLTSPNRSYSVLHTKGDNDNFWMNKNPEIVGYVLNRRPLWYNLLLSKMIESFIGASTANKTDRYVSHGNLRKYTPSISRNKDNANFTKDDDRRRNRSDW